MFEQLQILLLLIQGLNVFILFEKKS